MNDDTDSADLAADMAREEWLLDNAEERLHLIESTCADLIARIDRREYNCDPMLIRADLNYLRTCATKADQ